MFYYFLCLCPITMNKVQRNQETTIYWSLHDEAFFAVAKNVSFINDSITLLTSHLLFLPNINIDVNFKDEGENEKEDNQRVWALPCNLSNQRIGKVLYLLQTKNEFNLAPSGIILKENGVKRTNIGGRFIILYFF